jgi:hypothetical protein
MNEEPSLFPGETTITLSPREKYIILSGIETTEPHTINVSGRKIDIDWIASKGVYKGMGQTRNEAILNLCKAHPQLREEGAWTRFNWEG